MDSPNSSETQQPESETTSPSDDRPASFQDVRNLYKILAALVSGQLLDPDLDADVKAVGIRLFASAAGHFEGTEAAEDFLDAYTGGAYSLNKTLQEQGVPREQRLQMVKNSLFGDPEEN